MVVVVSVKTDSRRRAAGGRLSCLSTASLCCLSLLPLYLPLSTASLLPLSTASLNCLSLLSHYVTQVEVEEVEAEECEGVDEAEEAEESEAVEEAEEAEVEAEEGSSRNAALLDEL